MHLRLPGARTTDARLQISHVPVLDSAFLACGTLFRFTEDPPGVDPFFETGLDRRFPWEEFAAGAVGRIDFVGYLSDAD